MHCRKEKRFSQGCHNLRFEDNHQLFLFLTNCAFGKKSDYNLLNELCIQFSFIYKASATAKIAQG